MKRLSRNLVTISFVIAALVLILAACAQPAATPTPKPTPAPAPSPAPIPKPSPTPAPVQPKSGGIINTWSTVTPPNFDLHRKPGYGPFFGIPIFNNLVQYDLTKTEISTATIQPDLAERWEVSADGKVYTFYLVKGVKWHDGTAFTADDVVYSLEKMVDTKRSSLASDFPAFDKAERIDDTTVKVTLKFASPSFLVMLAGPYASIQPKHKSAVANNSTDFLVGTGPFKYKSYQAGVRMEYDKNPNYFKKDASGKQLPYLDGMTISIMASKSAILDAVITKRLDGTAAFALNTQEEWDRVMNQTKDFNAQAYTPPSLLLLWLNPKFEPFKNDKVRRAIQLSFDKKELTIAGWGDTRWGELNRTIFPKPFGLATDEMDRLLSQNLTKDARQAEAKKLLADAGFDKGIKVRFVLRNLDVHQRVATYLADQFSKIGIQTELMPRELTEARKIYAAADAELFIDNPLTLIGDPDEYKSYCMTTGAGNVLKAGNPDNDKLWTQQSQTIDLQKRIQLTQDIERAVIKDAWIVTLNNTNYTSGWWNYVKGFIPHPLNYSNKLRLETVWLDK